MPYLLLEHASIRDVRNVRHVELVPGTRLNVLAGDNGQGKTSLLEAIYFVATSRSFRTSRVRELVAHTGEVASVRARLVEGGGALPPISRLQLAAVRGGKCSVQIDGNRPTSLAAFATCSPVVVFHPDELALSTGPALLRRTLLDRVCLFVDVRALEHRSRYTHALRARQQLLQGHRGASSTADVDAFEQLCALHGAALTRARASAAALLIDALVPAFSTIAAPNLTLEARYAPAGSHDVGHAREELRRHRARDAHRPTAGFGPHRDDLLLCVDGHPARIVASKGQHRALALSLKAAEAASISRARNIDPILLLDDVSSELDASRTEALLAFLSNNHGQIFLTTTRPELIVTPNLSFPERRDFRVVEGGLYTLR